MARPDVKIQKSRYWCSLVACFFWRIPESDPRLLSDPAQGTMGTMEAAVPDAQTGEDDLEEDGNEPPASSTDKEFLGLLRARVPVFQLLRKDPLNEELRAQLQWFRGGPGHLPARFRHKKAGQEHIILAANPPRKELIAAWRAFVAPGGGFDVNSVYTSEELAGRWARCEHGRWQCQCKEGGCLERNQGEGRICRHGRRHSTCVEGGCLERNNKVEGRICDHGRLKSGCTKGGCLVRNAERGFDRQFGGLWKDDPEKKPAFMADLIAEAERRAVESWRRTTADMERRAYPDEYD